VCSRRLVAPLCRVAALAEHRYAVDPGGAQPCDRATPARS
jgi:hypothetical protein